MAAQLSKAAGSGQVSIEPWVIVTDVDYLTADEEEKFVIAQANAPLDENGHFRGRSCAGSLQRQLRAGAREPHRLYGYLATPDGSVATALIPFLEHDDVNRALMGANMQRQAVPLLRPQAPIVGTGIERQVAVDSGQVVVAAGRWRGRQRDGAPDRRG